MSKPKNPVIKTKRLILSPMTEEEISECENHAQDEDEAQAYREMLGAVRANPDNTEWYAPWKIALKTDKTVIGDVGFKGPVNSRHAIEIGYGLKREFWNQGYATEAAQGLIDWAFMQTDELMFIEAEAVADNMASQRVLAKLGFTQYGEGKEGHRYELERPKTSWLAIGMSLGMCFGISIGSLLFHDEIALGIGIGMGIGVAVGSLLDRKDNNRRKEIREERQQNQDVNN